MAQAQAELDEKTLDACLRHLRRHAYALTGHREIGDDLVDQASRELYATAADPPKQPEFSVLLFRLFHEKFNSCEVINLARTALLLHEVEKFGYDDVGRILRISREAAETTVKAAQMARLPFSPRKVLLIEDEAIIAMELTVLVAELGHVVSGVAMTRQQAVEVARADPPDLVVLDIELADGSSGLDAIRAITSVCDEVPVILSTGHPDRLLTDRINAPVCLLTKPSSEDDMRSAIQKAIDVSQKFPDPWHRRVAGLERFWPPTEPVLTSQTTCVALGLPPMS